MRIGVIVVLLIATAFPYVASENEDNCICTLQYDPVCCPDGETYSNSCFAKCAGNDPQTCSLGACESASPPPPQECICTREFEPVCCQDGQTYNNKCLASCAGFEPDTCTPGECGTPTPTPTPTTDPCSQQVNCLVDPCSLKWCPLHTCQSHTCSGSVDLCGVEVGPCAPVYVNWFTHKATANTCPFQFGDRKLFNSP